MVLTFEDLINEITIGNETNINVINNICYTHYNIIRDLIVDGIDKDIKLDYISRLRPNINSINRRKEDREKEKELKNNEAI